MQSVFSNKWILSVLLLSITDAMHFLYVALLWGRLRRPRALCVYWPRLLALP